MSDKEREVIKTAEKRAHHNALERKRRYNIKDSFTELKNSVPALADEKIASRALILKSTSDYLKHLKRRNRFHQRDINDLKRQYSILKNEINKLKKVKATESQPTKSVKLANSDQSGSENVDMSESENSDESGSENVDMSESKYSDESGSEDVDMSESKNSDESGSENSDVSVSKLQRF